MLCNLCRGALLVDTPLVMRFTRSSGCLRVVRWNWHGGRCWRGCGLLENRGIVLRRRPLLWPLTLR